MKSKASLGQTANILEVEGVCISVPQVKGPMLNLIETADFQLRSDQSLGIVGESGSGKTMLCRSLIGTLSRHGAVVSGGKIVFKGQDLTGVDESTWRQIRGRCIGYVPQSSLAGLNPVLTVRTQLLEAIRVVRKLAPKEAEEEAIQLLEQVHIDRPVAVLDARSDQLSGGMRQRVMIATAIAQKPDILIADEPTTALDVTIQSEILALINSLHKELGMALIFVSHDLAVVEEVCDSVMVMYSGASVEIGPIDAVVENPCHPYTKALLASRVDLATVGKELEAVPGDPASVGAWPTGCRFWPRCSLVDELCKQGVQPSLKAVNSQQTACLRADFLERNA